MLILDFRQAEQHVKGLIHQHSGWLLYENSCMCAIAIQITLQNVRMRGTNFERHWSQPNQNAKFCFVFCLHLGQGDSPTAMERHFIYCADIMLQLICFQNKELVVV